MAEQHEVTLSELIASYVRLRRAAGFRFKTQEGVLGSFLRFATLRGDTRVLSETAIEWARTTSSVHQRANRLSIVRALSVHAAAEDPRHEVPPRDVFGQPRRKRARPYIFSAQEIAGLLDLALRLEPRASIRPHTYYALFGLLAATGLRRCEALNLCVADLSPDGLHVRETKYRKSRLVPLHATTDSALQGYLERRRMFGVESDHVFVSLKGRIGGGDAVHVFRQLIEKMGLSQARGGDSPRLTDMRHTWAVRALEACTTPKEVPLHTRAVFTYLGHAKVASNYWYLHTTPQLMTDIADACEKHESAGR